MTASGFLAERDLIARERMDDPDCDPQMLDRTYARFGPLNLIVSRERRRFRRWIRPMLQVGRTSSLLDIGTGGADFPRRARAWAARAGLDLAVSGTDTDPRAVRYAERTADGAVELMASSSRELADAGRRFDIVTSNHVLHHLSDEEVRALFADTERLVAPGGIAIHSDIERAGLAYAGFAAATWPLQLGPLAGTFIRADGLVSIRRSRTAAELAALTPHGWRTHRSAPWRLDAVWVSQ